MNYEVVGEGETFNPFALGSTERHLAGPNQSELRIALSRVALDIEGKSKLRLTFVAGRVAGTNRSVLIGGKSINVVCDPRDRDVLDRLNPSAVQALRLEICSNDKIAVAKSQGAFPKGANRSPLNFTYYSSPNNDIPILSDLSPKTDTDYPLLVPTSFLVGKPSITAPGFSSEHPLFVWGFINNLQTIKARFFFEPAPEPEVPDFIKTFINTLT